MKTLQSMIKDDLFTYLKAGFSIHGAKCQVRSIRKWPNTEALLNQVVSSLPVTAFHCFKSDGQWYTKYSFVSGNVPHDFKDYDTCNLVYTTSHESFKEAKEYTPSMRLFNSRH